MPASSPKESPRSLADALPALKEPLLRALRVGTPLLLAGLALWIVIVAGFGAARPVCSSCHRSVAARGQQGAHADVSCDRCHAPDLPERLRLRALEGSVMPAAQLLGSRSSGRASRLVGDKGCLSCHSTIKNEITLSEGLAMSHETCVQRSQRCTDCHGGTGHEGKASASRKADMTDCLHCHDGRTAGNECRLCHRGERPKARYKSGSWAAVHLDGSGKAHGMGDLESCRSCHADSKCISCHGIPLPHSPGFPLAHGKSAVRAPKSCPQCHERAGCDGCHGVDMPHPKGFLAAHTDGVRDEKDPRCLKCHRQEDCDRCHVKHSHPGKQTGYSGPYW